MRIGSFPIAIPASGTGTVEDDCQAAHFLAGDFYGIDQGCGCHNSGSVLLIMENWDIAKSLKPAFNLKAAGSGNIFQIDAAKLFKQSAFSLQIIMHFNAS